MSRYRTVLMILLGALTAGCSNLQRSIEQRITVSEQCRMATAAVPTEFDIKAPLASIHLGNVGKCSLSYDETLLPICALEQIGNKYGLPAIPSAPAPQLDGFQTAVNGLRQELRKLGNMVQVLDREYLRKIKNGSYATRTNLMRDAAALIGGDIPAQLLEVRKAQNALRKTMELLVQQSYGQARVELAAWDANLRMQLAQLERLLSGDVQLIARDGLRDEVITHVARRSLDLLHGSLKAADLALAKIDDKAYGAVSIGYLAFSPDIQDAVDKAVGDLKKTYRKRAGTEATDANSDVWLKQFLREIRRSACNKLVEGEQFTMLTELVDTMLITQINNEDPLLPGPDVNTAPAIAAVEGAPQFHFHMDVSPAPAGAPAPANPPALAPTSTSPLAVYMANEWMARQHLLTRKIAAALEAEAARGASASPMTLPDITTVDEGEIRELAEAATATAIDDVTRSRPDLLRDARDISAVLQNHVAVASAAAAVSHASVNLKLNLSVSNVNNYNPSNHNAPVFNLPPQTAPVVVERPITLCDAIGIATYGAECSEDRNGYIVSFNARAFQSDSCNPADLEPALSAVGRTLASYRARNGLQWDAVIHGFASLPPARLAKCPIAQKASANSCVYVNRARADFAMQKCGAAGADRNVALSAARAGRAAAALERSAQGAVTVTDLVARGTDTARLRLGERAHSEEQTVIIWITQRTAK
jgi:hypothetical protein